MFVSTRRDATAARRFFDQAINATRVRPVEVTTDKAPVYPAVLEDLLPAVHTPVVELDEEQHVQPLQEYGVHGEEVAGEDAGCLATQERPCGGVIEAGSRA